MYTDQRSNSGQEILSSIGEGRRFSGADWIRDQGLFPSPTYSEYFIHAHLPEEISGSVGPSLSDGDAIPEDILTPKLPSHYSPSQINMASDCGRKYYYEYILGIRHNKPNPFFILGSAADRTIEICLSNRSSDILPSQIFQEELKKEMEGKDLTPDQKDKVDKQAISLEILLNNYLNLFIDYEPISFQRKMTLRIKGVGPIIFGYSDIIGKRDGKNLIIDIKTSGKQMSQPSPTHRTQMMFYCLSLMKMDKLTEIPDLELHYLVKTREPKINIVKVDVRESDLYHLISSIREHHWRIQQGFYPLNRNSVWCSESGCDHYEKCHSDCSMTIENTMDQVIIEEAT